jgi:hypothetical protein
MEDAHKFALGLRLQHIGAGAGSSFLHHFWRGFLRQKTIRELGAISRIARAASIPFIFGGDIQQNQVRLQCVSLLDGFPPEEIAEKTTGDDLSRTLEASGVPCPRFPCSSEVQSKDLPCE